MPAIEDHGAGSAALALLAVDVEPHAQMLRILDLVLGDEPRPERTEALGAFAFGPLPGALELEDALGHVVRQAIAGDHVQRLLLGEVARAPADDDGELDFPVELARLLGDDRIVVRPADAGRHLVEDDRLFGNSGARFGRMVGIVEPDGDEVGDAADAGAEPRLAGDERQLLDRRLADLGEPCGRERLPGNVRHHFRQVADASFGIDDSRLFAAAWAEADELHGFSLGLTAVWDRVADHASVRIEGQGSRPRCEARRYT